MPTLELLFVFGCAGSSLLCMHFKKWDSHCGDISYCRARALEHRLSSCGPRAELTYAMWNPPGLGIEQCSRIGRWGFLTTGPPGKSQITL